jgi:hypothetical protein
MRTETKSKLDRLLFMRKLKWTAAGIGLAILMAGGLYLSGLDATVEDRRIAGVIEGVGSYNGSNTQGVQNGLAVDVKLDDGRHVHVLVLKQTAPTVGSRVEVTEHHHGSGRTTFSWK